MEATRLAEPLEHLEHTPLDAVDPDVAEALLRDVFDRGGEEEPVYVARFGSGI